MILFTYLLYLVTLSTKNRTVLIVLSTNTKSAFSDARISGAKILKISLVLENDQGFLIHTPLGMGHTQQFFTY